MPGLINGKKTNFIGKARALHATPFTEEKGENLKKDLKSENYTNLLPYNEKLYASNEFIDSTVPSKFIAKLKYDT